MEFIKHGKNYIIKNSNGRIISEKEKLELENNELILKDIKSNDCQQETTKKISKNKKRIKELENEEIIANVKFSAEELEPKAIVKKIKALNQEGDSANDIIEETTESI